MRVFLMTDLEGIAGVESIEQMDRAGAHYADICRKLEQSINAAVDTCFQNGANTVYYLDGHGGGGNVLPENIDPRAIRCKDVHVWSDLVRQRAFDCQLELGAHARAGSVGGFLDHTLNSKQLFCVKHNGVEMSEVSLHATLCAKYGIPVVGVTGCETACVQAKQYIPGIVTGAVKVAYCRNVAKTYETAEQILRNAVASGLQNWKGIPLISYAEPLTVEQIYYRSDFCEEKLATCGSETKRMDARTLQKTVNEIRTYGDLKF